MHQNNYHLKLCGQNDTIGNVLQSHIVDKFIDNDSLLNFCGYNKSHPLEEHINLFVGLNPKHDMFDKSEEMKLHAMVKFIDDVTESLISIYRAIGKEAMKSL